MDDKILQLLLKLGVLSSAQVEEILKKKPAKEDIVSFLIKNGYVDEGKFLNVLSYYFGLETLKELPKNALNEELLKRVSREILRKYRVIPYQLENGTLKVLTTNPFNTNALNTFKFLYKVQKIVPIVVNFGEPLRPKTKVGAPKKREIHPEIKTNSSFSIIFSTFSQVEGLIK